MPSAPQSFIERWHQSDGSERANYQLFLSELCDFLGIDRPEPSQGIEDFNTYVFDKSIEIRNPDGTLSRGFIDLYKKNHFVLEAKQGSKPFTLQVDGDNNLILQSPTSARPQRRRGTATRALTAGTKRCAAPTTRPKTTPRPSPSGLPSSSP